MEERIDEGKIKGSIDAIPLKNIEKIAEQMKSVYICKVYGDLIGTGFFCKIPYEGKSIPALITNYHIISDDFLKNNQKVKISINDGKVFDTIKINENSKIYSSIRNEYDIMIIKLEEEKDIYHYLDLDEHIFDENSEDIYENKSIYILHYPNGDKIHISFGYGIQKLDEYYIKHLCNTEHCSSGSPILNLETNKVIGIHSGTIIKNYESKYNIGILLKYPLNQLNKNNEIKEKKRSIINQIKNNEIKITIEINKDDINKDIYFLDNTDYNDDNNINHYHDHLKELNELNTELYINDIKYKYKKYFDPDKEGKYIIKLKFNIYINDLSFMFYNCNNIINIDLSSFQETKNVNNMSYMFCGCKSLESLSDISNWYTTNVKNMIWMFAGCDLLEFLPDISKWDTKNVNDMSDMFNGCGSLKSLPDISKWDTKNVKNMRGMFYDCNSLISLPDISKWNTKNVNDMSYIFYDCNLLKSFPNISEWDTKNVHNMSYMFAGCNSLKSLPDISKWYTINVKNMIRMFAGCNSLESLPDISKWNTPNVNDMSDMFKDCESLKKIPSKFLSK